jgi:hypothetical protein
MKTTLRSFKSATIVFAALLVLGLMASLSYAATGGFHGDRQASSVSPTPEPTDCAPTDDGTTDDQGTTEDGDGNDQGTTEDGDSDDQGTTEEGDADDQGEDCESDDDAEDEDPAETEDAQEPSETDPEREAACNEAAGIDPTADPEPVEGEPEKATGLDNAIEHVLANCMKNEKAPGLLNALQHLVANQERKEIHDAWKAEHEHGKPDWAGGGKPPWAGGGKPDWAGGGNS